MDVLWERQESRQKERCFIMLMQTQGNGAPCRIRTYDTRLRRPVLYPTELRALRLRRAAQNRPNSIFEKLKLSA